MEVKEAIMAILPELEELDEVDFRQYSPPYPNLLKAFLESGKKGLPEFERFAESTVGKDAVGQILLSLLQYLLIRYRRFKDYSVVKPAIKVFLTLKGWLLENGFEKEWDRVLGSFIGYLVSMLPLIAEREEGDMALAYAKLIEDLTREASEKFDEEYYHELLERVNELKKDIEGKTNA
ncbi:hypothetical protein [Thermococcus sp.]|uniref:hypothetical protein n=1 Tax=Thermococcus sp. TaxID=35749 RepID=UPI0026260196|nr:hypothetical protein [Thermococcus sp.]